MQVLEHKLTYLLTTEAILYHIFQLIICKSRSSLLLVQFYIVGDDMEVLK